MQNKKYGTLIADPGTGIEKPGYTFDGWYSSSGFEASSLWDFATNKVGEDGGDLDPCTLTLYAK